MTPRSLFIIILKVFGIFFIKETIGTLIELVSSVLYWARTGYSGEEFWAIVFAFIFLVFYGLVTWLLLFRTTIIIDKLKLDQGFDQKNLDWHFSPTSLLNVAVIVTGAVILLNEIPYLCRELFGYFQQRRLMDDMTPDLSFAFFSVIKIIIAVLLIVKRKTIVAFVRKDRREKATDNE